MVLVYGCEISSTPGEVVQLPGQKVLCPTGNEINASFWETQGCDHGDKKYQTKYFSEKAWPLVAIITIIIFSYNVQSKQGHDCKSYL